MEDKFQNKLYKNDVIIVGEDFMEVLYNLLDTSAQKIEEDFKNEMADIKKEMDEAIEGKNAAKLSRACNRINKVKFHVPNQFFVKNVVGDFYELEVIPASLERMSNFSASKLIEYLENKMFKKGEFQIFKLSSPMLF